MKVVKGGVDELKEGGGIRPAMLVVLCCDISESLEKDEVRLGTGCGDPSDGDAAGPEAFCDSDICGAGVPVVATPEVVNPIGPEEWPDDPACDEAERVVSINVGELAWWNPSCPLVGCETGALLTAEISECCSVWDFGGIVGLSEST